MAVGDRIPICDVCDLRLGRDRIGVREIDLEGHGDKRVGEREHEVCAHGSEPAPYDHLVELQGRVVLRVDVGHVNGEVE